MTIKKLSKRQIYWVKFLSRFNFVISNIWSRKNGKADSLTGCPKNWLVDDYDNQQQHLLQTIFLLEKLKMSFIDPQKSKTTFKKIIQGNWVDFSCIKLCKTIRISSPIGTIITYYLSNVSIDSTNDYIYRSNHFWVPNNL